MSNEGKNIYVVCFNKQGTYLGSNAKKELGSTRKMLFMQTRLGEQYLHWEGVQLIKQGWKEIEIPSCIRNYWTGELVEECLSNWCNNKISEEYRVVPVIILWIFG